VIIVGYKSRPVLEKCLASIEKQTLQPDETIFVNNGCDNASVSLIRERFSFVTVLDPGRNLGFAGGCNIAMESVETGMVALLNPDTEAEPGWLEEIVKAADNHPDEIGAFASRVHWAGDPTFLQSTGDSYSVVGTSLPIGFGDDPALHLEPGFVFGPAGCAAAFRTHAIREAGLFDQDFFAYYDDADLSFRLNLLGYKCLYVPGAIVRHLGQYEWKGRESRIERLSQRNMEWVYFRDMPLILIFAFLPEKLFFEAVSLLRFAAKGDLELFLSAKIGALINAPKILRRRKKIQSERRISSMELLKRLDHRWIRSRLKYENALSIMR